MGVFRGLFVRPDATRGTQPAEARKALAGLLVPSSVVGARQGILAGPGDPLRVTGTADWTYQVNGGHLVSSRGDTDGTVLFGNDGTTQTPAVAAAPESGSRWDLIYLRHEDVDKGGGETSAATLGVVSGVASGTPVRPTVPAGAVVLAEALVSAGATSTSHANVTITQVLGRTVARGGILPVASQAERDALAAYPGLPVYRIDTGDVEVSDGAVWDVPSRSAVGGIHAQDAEFPVAINSTSEAVLSRITIPSASYARNVAASGSAWLSYTQTGDVDLIIYAGSTVVGRSRANMTADVGKSVPVSSRRVDVAAGVGVVLELRAVRITGTGIVASSVSGELTTFVAQSTRA